MSRDVTSFELTRFAGDVATVGLSLCGHLLRFTATHRQPLRLILS
jgi:hypothetical protein